MGQVMIINTDTVINIFKLGLDDKTGLDSIYTTREHPGSNKKIEAWKWDNQFWPLDKLFLFGTLKQVSSRQMIILQVLEVKTI